MTRTRAKPRAKQGPDRAIAGLAAAIATAFSTLVGAIPGGVTAAHAQTAQAGRGTDCSPRPGRLGVSRIVEIDTASGPRFGQQQYKDHDFLREGEVVLTFDDGPLRRHTRAVLDALAAHCTRATFYMVGQMALTDPEMVREVAKAGHTVGIHTWSHRNLRATGTAAAVREIELGISAVQRALGAPVAPFFRFPYLADSSQMLAHLAERRFAVFSIDVDSRDFRTQDPGTMQRTVMTDLRAKGKGILLFHDIQTSTARGISGVLTELAARGFRVVHTVPKAPATTIASYDAAAETELARRSRVAAANPMAQRSVVWPMSNAAGVPVEQYRPGSTGASATGSAAAARPVNRPAQARAEPAAAPGGPIPPPPAPALPPAIAAQPAPAPPPRPAFRDTYDDDWRMKAFGN